MTQKDQPDWREIADELAEALDRLGHGDPPRDCRTCAALRRYEEARNE